MNPICLPDLIAQSLVLTVLILGLIYRDEIEDFTNGNIDRLEREEAQAAEAQWWLEQMKKGEM